MDNSNPFDSLPDAKPEEANAQQAADPFDSLPSAQSANMAPPETSKFQTLMDGVVGFNKQFDNMALGAMQTISRAIPGTVGTAIQNSIRQVHNQKDAEYQAASERSPVATTVGAIAGGIGSGIAYGNLLGAGAIGAMGKLSSAAPTTAGLLTKSMEAHPILRAVGAGAGVGGALGAIDYSNSPQETLAKSATGVVLGGILGGAIPVGQKILSGKKEALADASSMINSEIQGDPNKIYAALKSAKEQGVNLSMGEAFPKSAGVAEVGLNPTNSMKDTLLRPQYIQKIKAGQQKVNDIIDNMAPKDVGDQIVNLETKLSSQFISPANSIETDAAKAGVSDIIKSNPILASKYNDMLNAQSQAFKQIPNNSLLQLQKMKQSISDDLSANTLGGAKYGDMKNLTQDDRNALIEAKNLLSNPDKTGILDKSPDYQIYSKLLQQSAIKNKYVEGMQELKSNANGVGFNNPLLSIRNKFFSNKLDTEQFLKDVSASGGDVMQAQQVVDLTNTLSTSPLRRLLNVPSDNASHVRKFATQKYGVANLVDNVLNGRYYKAWLELSYNSDWAPQVAAVIDKGSKVAQAKGFAGLIKMVGRNVATGAKNAAILGSSQAVSQTMFPEQQ